MTRVDAIKLVKEETIELGRMLRNRENAAGVYDTAKSDERTYAIQRVREETIDLGRALRDHEKAVGAYGKAKSDDDRAELRLAIWGAREWVMAADARSAAAFVALQEIEEGSN